MTVKATRDAIYHQLFQILHQVCKDVYWHVRRIEGIDMTETTRRSHAQAYTKLSEARGHLLCARLAALDAQLWLVGAHVSNGGGEQYSDARIKRAAKLCELVTDAVAHADRLMFYVEGDGAC